MTKDATGRGSEQVQHSFPTPVSLRTEHCGQMSLGEYWRLDFTRPRLDAVMQPFEFNKKALALARLSSVFGKVLGIWLGLLQLIMGLKTCQRSSLSNTSNDSIPPTTMVSLSSKSPVGMSTRYSLTDERPISVATTQVAGEGRDPFE